jgi:hypothetical protein
MTRVFWVIATGWVFGVIGAMPSALEQMHRRGAGLLIPGFAPTSSDVVITAAMALLPPLLAAAVIRSRRGRR